MKFAIKFLVFVFTLSLFGCTSLGSVDYIEPVPGVQLHDAVETLPFCEAETYLLFRNSFQSQSSESQSYDICVSEQKVEFRSEVVSAGITVSYAQQVYYLPDLNYQDFLDVFSAKNLMNTDEEIDYSVFGTCHAWQTLTVHSLSSTQSFERGEPCSGMSEPQWVTSVQGDFDGAVLQFKEKVPNLELLLEMNLDLPYPPDASIYYGERDS